MTKVDAFLKSTDNFFLLAGYSGCGKTTIAENIANFKNASLLAPTNAAVNRLREKINNNALQYSTIHKLLFAPKDDKGNFRKEKSFQSRRVYIIDECSMVDKYVLDIIIKDAVDRECKIIFMGDSFQLEPVGENPWIFRWEESYPDHFFEDNRYELTEVKRYDGSLLKIATEMRINKLAAFTQPANSDLSMVPKFTKNLARDIMLGSNYVVLTSTNKRRVQYNESIRSYLYNDPQITGYARKNELVVAVSNSNHYSNGEIYKLESPQLIEEFTVCIEAKNGEDHKYQALLYNDYGSLTILLPGLDKPSLSPQQIMKSIEDHKTKLSPKVMKMLIIQYTNKKLATPTTTTFFNKDVTLATFGYAISCHKAQGQEWENVYIDAAWLMPVWDSAKWFYTAITRAKSKVEVTDNRYLTVIP